MLYIDNGWTFFSTSSRKNSVNAVIEGVRISINLVLLNNIEKIQPRMMVAKFNCNPSTTIISCSSRIEASDEMVLIIFFNELYSFVRSNPKHSVLFIVGDTNSQIGKDKNNKISSHNSSNRNGEHLIYCCIVAGTMWLPVSRKYKRRHVS